MHEAAAGSMADLLETGFSGRIIQVTEALDPGDAVSNQILDMDRMFKRMGLESIVLSKYHHHAVAAFRADLESIQTTEKDIVIFHFCGFTEYGGPWTLSQYCTRVMFYHNITPHHFFPEGSALYEFCRRGRDQLKEIVPQFHVHWGASAYNLEELHAAGADPTKSKVIPIIVPDAPLPLGKAPQRKEGHWLFLGRIVANKCQLDLIDLFAAARKADPEMAQKLTFVGGYDPNSDYYRQVVARIAELKLGEAVELTSKISDAEREAHFRSSQFYVAISEHEGFGVPLVEAPLRGLPVLALDRAAAAETTGGVGLSQDRDGLIASMRGLFKDPVAIANLLKQQQANAARFSEARVDQVVRGALADLLPPPDLYKTVSVVICTYNRIDHLKRCLDYLRFQSNLNFEVVVVDGPSDDGTKEFLAAYGPGIKIFENPLRNLSVSRNIGIEKAAGDIVAFIDDDAIPFDNWVDELLKAYNERPTTVIGMGGPVFFAGSLTFQSEDIAVDNHARTMDWIKPHQLAKDGWYRAQLGTNSTFVRETLAAQGGFDEQFDYFLDESELCLRLQLRGYLLGYSPQVLVRHEFAQSHNRRGKYKYDWTAICKNIAYFVAAYSGLKGDALREYLENRLQVERVNPLKAAYENGELTKEELQKGEAAIWAGLEKGLTDVRDFPKTRQIGSSPPPFEPFEIEPGYRAVGRDIRQLHICIISKEAPPFFGSGGIGTLYYHLISELLLMGHIVSLIIPSHENRYVRQGPFTLYYTQHRGQALHGLDPGLSVNIAWSLSALARVTDVHRERPVDVVDSALWDAEALAFSTIDRRNRPPLVVRLVTPFKVAADMNEWQVPEPAMEAFVAAERTLIENADAVIPISRKIATTITEEYDVPQDDRWDMAPCGIAYWPLFDVRENYAELEQIGGLDGSALSHDKIILFVGRLELRKGIDLMIDAIGPILEGDPTARIVIAGKDGGDWQRQALARMTRAQALRVHFLTDVPDALRDKLLANAHCLVFPSRYESFGLVPLEAFVHKVPVVASRSGAIPEVVLDDDCGLLFTEGDSDELADAVLRLLKDEALHARLSEGAERRAHVLSARNSAIHSVGVYARLIKKNVKPALPRTKAGKQRSAAPRVKS